MRTLLFASALSLLRPEFYRSVLPCLACSTRVYPMSSSKVSVPQTRTRLLRAAARRELSPSHEVSAISSSPSPKKSPRKKSQLPVFTCEQMARALEKGRRIHAALSEVYPIAPKGFLDHKNNFTLLVAVVLSAQTTDLKVNAVTPVLFKAADNPGAMIELGVPKVLDIIRTVGLAPQKAKALIGLSTKILQDFNGDVPETFEELESLPGVGHKTASVVMMQAFGKPAFPVDTHIHRLACRWGCGDGKSVAKTEALLKLWFPDQTMWGDLHTRIILFGRQFCPAQNHDMENCPVCSFAATDEARQLNRSSPKKFIAPPTYKDRFTIRDCASTPSARALEIDADMDTALSNLESSSGNVKITNRSTKTQSTSRTTVSRRVKKQPIIKNDAEMTVEHHQQQVTSKSGENLDSSATRTRRVRAGTGDSDFSLQAAQEAAAKKQTRKRKAVDTSTASTTAENSSKIEVTTEHVVERRRYPSRRKS